MNHRQRVQTALSHRQPDKVPYHIDFTEKILPKMIDYYGGQQFLASLGNNLTLLGTEPANAWQEVRPNIWRDQFGVEWDRTMDKDIGVVCNRLITPQNLDTFVFPDPYEPSRYESLKQALVHPQRDEQFIVVNYGFSLFERAWTLTGEEDLLAAMVLDKTYAHRLLDRILEFNLELISNVCAYDIDAMMFGDDWGYQRGVVMGANRWQEYIKPRVKQMYGLVKSAGKRVFIHSRGKVDELFPDLIEIGLDVFNPFQPEVMDVYEMKKEYGKDLSFFGGISTQRLLPYGMVQEVKDEVKRLLEVVGKDGGYIAAPAHSIPGDAKPENVAAVIEVLQSQ